MSQSSRPAGEIDPVGVAAVEVERDADALTMPAVVRDLPLSRRWRNSESGNRWQVTSMRFGGFSHVIANDRRVHDG